MLRKQQRRKHVSDRLRDFEQYVRQICQPNEVETEMRNFRNWCLKIDVQHDPRVILRDLESVYVRHHRALGLGDDIAAERTRYYLGVVFEKMLEGRVLDL